MHQEQPLPTVEDDDTLAPAADVSAQLAEILRTVKLVAGEHLVELRVLDVDGRDEVWFGYFDGEHRTELGEAAMRFNRRGGVYTTLNRPHDGLLARAPNRMVRATKKTKATSDRDIVRREWLGIDFDPKRPAGISSTDAEKECARQVAQACYDWLVEELGFPLPIVGDSGNGWHMLFKIDLPADAASEHLFKACLAALGHRFANDQVDIDPAVFNAARIWKLYGSYAIKGADTHARPHRLARLVKTPETGEAMVVSRESLEKLAVLAPQAQKQHGSQGATEEAPALARRVRELLTSHDCEIKNEGPYRNTYRIVAKVCPFDRAHNDFAVFVSASDRIRINCFDPACKGKTWGDVCRLLGAEETGARATADVYGTASGDSQLASDIRSIALEEYLATFDKRRHIARLINDHLASIGKCFHTPDNRGFYFHKSERRIFDIDGQGFERLVASVSGLSLTESYFQFAVDQLRTHVLRDSPTSAVHTLAYYSSDSGLVALSDGGSGIWMREKGGQWQARHNGDEGIFFAMDEDSTPWLPEFDDPEALRWFVKQLLFADHEPSTEELSVEDSQALVLVWLLQQFFPELRRTRLVACFLGPQGSGKSTAARLIGRVLVGPRFDVTGVRREKEDAFVAAVTNRTVLALDNADSRIPWLPDALATYATGQRYRMRKLYTTNEELAYAPRAILLITSRDPRFNRADVVERLLPLYFERPPLYRAEAEIFGELERRRGAIMGALLLQLGEIADALATCPAKPLAFRMADFASFGERIFAARGTSSAFLDLLARLERTQARFASEADGLVEALRLLLEQERVEDVAIGDLFKKCRKIAEENGIQIARSSQGFGRHLSNIRRVIEIELQVRLIEVAPHARYRRISLVPVGDRKPTSEPTHTEESHGVN